jgi:hypothetical protein
MVQWLQELHIVVEHTDCWTLLLLLSLLLSPVE